MSSAVKAKLATKVMTNCMILTTSMGFQVLRKEVMLTAFEAREKLLRLWASALQTRSVDATNATADGLSRKD